MLAQLLCVGQQQDDDLPPKAWVMGWRERSTQLLSSGQHRFACSANEVISLDNASIDGFRRLTDGTLPLAKAIVDVRLARVPY